MMENGFDSTQFTPLGQHFKCGSKVPKRQVAIHRQVRILGAHHFSPVKWLALCPVSPEVCAALERMLGTE